MYLSKSSFQVVKSLVWFQCSFRPACGTVCPVVMRSTTLPQVMPSVTVVGPWLLPYRRDCWGVLSVCSLLPVTGMWWSWKHCFVQWDTLLAGAQLVLLWMSTPCYRHSSASWEHSKGRNSTLCMWWVGAVKAAQFLKPGSVYHRSISRW